ncbi:MAG: monovalent cation/H+ antiporter complex subunit F [Litorimonas sp.]
MEASLEYIFLASAFLLIVSMAMMLGRLLGGPSLYDRLLAVNSFGTKTVLFLCVFCFIIGRPDGVDIALLYALMNFIATIAVLKFFNYRALDVTLVGQSVSQNVDEDTNS